MRHHVKSNTSINRPMFPHSGITCLLLLLLFEMPRPIPTLNLHDGTSSLFRTPTGTSLRNSPPALRISRVSMNLESPDSTTGRSSPTLRIRSVSSRRRESLESIQPISNLPEATQPENTSGRRNPLSIFDSSLEHPHSETTTRSTGIISVLWRDPETLSQRTYLPR